MMTDSDLEARFAGWAKEYGGGRYEHIGYSSRNLLQTLIEHGGFVPDAGGFKRPPVRTAADEVEIAVRAMESSGMFKQGRIVRCEYFLPDSPEEVKLANLRKIGLPVSRSGYYVLLAIGKAYVRGVLSVKTTSCV